MSATSQLPTTTPTASAWKLDPAHSVAEFKVRHMMISTVRGQFTGLTGVLTLDETDVTKSSIDASAESSSVNTHEAQRDAHLTSADFFNVLKYPKLTFRSTRIERAADGDLKVTGDLTIHGVTNEVVFAVEGPTAPGKDPWGNTRIGLSATTKINRRDYGLTWNAVLETGGLLVGEDVTITIDAQFVKS